MTKNFKKKFFPQENYYTYIKKYYLSALYASHHCYLPILQDPLPSVLLASVEIYYLQCLKKFYRTHLTDSPYQLGAGKLDH